MTDSQDNNHLRSKVLATWLAQEHWRLYTSNLVLTETHALLLSRLGREIALRVLHEIDRGATTVIRATIADERKAREILDKFRDKDFSLCDATSFAIMHRLGLAYAFTFDQHFAQYGLTILVPPPP